MKHIQKWSALLMAVTLLFTLAAPAALATESTVTIKTAEDLAELSRNCTLDTWSQGKTVILKNDLDLPGVAFTPLPTFPLYPVYRNYSTMKHAFSQEIRANSPENVNAIGQLSN